MSWLGENWGWVLIGFAVLYFITRAGHRGGGMGGFGGVGCGGSRRTTSASSDRDRFGDAQGSQGGGEGSQQPSGGSTGQADEPRRRRRGGC